MSNLIGPARQQFAQCVFTHKVQESASDRLHEKANYVQYGNIIIVSLILTFLVLQLIFDEQSVFGYVSVGLTVVEIIYLIIQLSFNFSEKQVLHKNSALQYMNLRDGYLNYISDIHGSIDESTLIARRDLLQTLYQTISELSPHTKYEDYVSAQIKLFGKIKEGEQYTRSEEEINRFLPNDLHSKIGDE